MSLNADYYKIVMITIFVQNYYKIVILFLIALKFVKKPFY